MRGRKSLWLCASAAVVLAGALAGTAQAQDQESTEVEGLVITGTSIRGVAATGSPTTTLNLEEVKATGVTQASEAVRLLPQILNLGADETRNSFTSVAGGGAAQDAAANATAVRSVNLRGIGPEATLLLVNGRRIPPSGVIKAISDLDLLPTNALSRIEVVADGASAIYGSDAVAGVVNLITRRPRDGLELMARYGGADGMEQVLYGVNYGKTWQGGGLFIAYENNDRSNLSGADRDFASQDTRARGGLDNRPFTAAPGNITLNPTTGAACSLPPNAPEAGTATCRRYALPAGNGVNVNPAAITSGVGNRYDEGFAADLLPEQHRDSVFLTLRQELTETIDVWYEGAYSYRGFDQAQPAAAFSLAVTNANPYFVRPTSAPAGTSQNVEYRFLDDSNPNSDGWERTYLNSVGLGWDLPSDWRMEAYANFGVDDGVQRRQSVLNNTILGNALRSTDPATAFNPFGDGTFNRTNNAALVELIDGERNQFATSRTQDYSVKFDGPLFAIGGGDVKLAVGADYHDNSFKQALYATNVGATGAVSTKFVNNDREISSLFAEVFTPLVSDANARPGIQRLDLSLAVRYDDYSDFGDTTNPKIGLTWAPVEDLSFRATYGTSFRAPSLVDTADQILNIFIQALPATSGTVNGIYYNGGNSAVQPEEATTYTAGLDWNPARFEGLRVNATYYNIEYTDLIDVAPRTALANAAYGAPFVLLRPPATDTAGTNAFNAMVAALMASPDLQNAPQPVANINAIVDGRRNNLGRLQMDGVDLGVFYDFTSAIGDWTAGLDVSKILAFERATTPLQAPVNVLDTFSNPIDLRARASLAWRSGPWAAYGFVNYVDGYTNTAVATTSPNRTVDSWTTVDASVSYEFLDEGPLKGVRLIASGQNLFDEDPPVVLNGTVSWDSQGASPVGRYLSLEINKRF